MIYDWISQLYNWGDTAFQGTMSLCFENQKRGGIYDLKDFGRVEASLYLK